MYSIRRCVRFNRNQTASAFTLVELLIVIAIIGVLVALTMPAVNAARESARRTQCMNNAKQLAAAYIAHEATHGVLAGGGWGWGWVGDPDRGVGMRQPGGWIYNILPYIDQVDLHDMSKNASLGLTDPQKIAKNNSMVAIPLGATLCPSRRSLRTFPWKTSNKAKTNFDPTTVTAVGRSDYASNGGDIKSEPSNINLWDSNCGTRDCGPDPKNLPTDALLAAQQQKVAAFNNGVGPTGVDAPLTSLTTASIKDGASFTYLLGEKFIEVKNYLNGLSNGDNETQFGGHDSDISRWTSLDGKNPLPPRQDTPDDIPKIHFQAFGSAHPAGFHMAFCDGSVKKLAFDISPTIHMSLGNRNDGQPTQLQDIDPSGGR